MVAWACRPAGESATPATPEPSTGGNVTLALAADLANVNELLAGGSQVSADILRRQLFATLFEEQADFAEHPPTFEPGLAESWEWSPDHLVLTVKLRPAVWSDGVAIDAEKVQTNIVIFDVSGSGKTSARIVEELKQEEIYAIPFGKAIRMVTHCDVSSADIEKTLLALEKIIR